jgi:YHS domain-containing protein
MTMSRNGVCYDLAQSPYTYQIDNVTYIFSSKSHKQKFKLQYKENRDKFKEKFVKKYGIELDTNCLSDLLLYETIETRGFMLEIESGGYVKCLNEIILSGVNVTKRNLTD